MSDLRVPMPDVNTLVAAARNGILVTLDAVVLSLIPKNQRYRVHVVQPLEY